MVAGIAKLRAGNRGVRSGAVVDDDDGVGDVDAVDGVDDVEDVENVDDDDDDDDDEDEDDAR